MRIFANKKFKRFVIILVTVIMLFNVIAPQPLVPQAEAASVGGILMAPLTALAGGLAWAFQQVLNLVMYVGTSLTAGAMPEEQNAGDVFITDIVYNQLAITNANIFDTENPNPLLQSAKDENGGITGIVKQWYGITRMMAIAASLVILVYVAIKIIIASTGKDKAKYTELLKDWLLSLLLIFTLHYVMAAILFCSDAIVNFFLSTVKSAEGGIFSYKSIQDQTFAFNDYSIIYALVWIALLIYTFVFLVLYIKRLILICFFVVISPLIVILSTINKLRGKGSGILDTWLKQFIANVVMQPIDALLFTIIASSIVICIEGNQPLLALAFVIAFFPMRTWVTQFFDQKAEQNSQQDAAKFAAGGANMFSSKIQGMANAPKKPKFNTSNISAAIAGVGRGSPSGSTGGSTGGSSGGSTGGSMGGKVPLSDSWENDWKNNKGNWSNNDEIISTPESLQAEIAGGTPNVFNAEQSTALPAGTSKAKFADRHATLSKGAGILGRAAKYGAVKGTGALIGTTVGGLNAIAGNGFGKHYTPASNATEKLMGKTIDRTAKKASEYYGSAENGGLSGIYEQLASDVGSIKDSATDYVNDSYIVSGEEGIVDDKVALGQFFADAEVDDMIHELIMDCGEGDQLYDQYMATSSVSTRREIAQQFFMESAIKDYGGADRFSDLVKRRKNSEMKAMLSVMQKHKGALTGKNAEKKKEQVRQRSVNYNNNNNTTP